MNSQAQAGGGDVPLGRGPRSEIAVFSRGMGRAVGGALIFSLPMLMTMEMWQLGSYLERPRLVLLLVINIPLLVVLSSHVGFERTSSLAQDIRDAMIAYGIGVLVGAIGLAAFGVIGPGMPLDDIAGKVGLQAMPASFGALLGRSQLGGQKPGGQGSEKQGPGEQGSGEQGSGEQGSGENGPKSHGRYASEIFLMAVGALFLSLNVAPTEEMVLISYQMSEWHAVVLILVSLLVMHGFVYSLEFSGSHTLPGNTPRWHAFVHFTLVGYGVAFLISLYALWTFGRTDGTALAPVIMSSVVLAFPAALGAAAARLIL